ncbi:MAG: hypothetical protein ACK5V4_02725 [Alphaproteobacteria bacterium]
MQSKTVLMMSLGQLHNSSVSSGIFEFADLVHNHSAFPGFLYPAAVLYSTAVYATDHFWFGKIDSYKRGEMNDQQFRTYLKSWFGSSISDHKIDEAWNSVCHLDNFSSQNVKSLIKFLENNTNVYMLLLSSTNHMNFECCKTDLDFNDQIKFGLSFEHGTLSLKEIAAKALNDIEYDQLISFHRDLDASAIGSEGKMSSSYQYNPSKDGYVGEYLESLVQSEELIL